MTTLNVGKSLRDTDVLWRYLSLDKFIDFVESESLFFAPLAWYEKTDPFEGYLPRVAMNAMASVSINARNQQLETINALARTLPESAATQLRLIREQVETHIPTMRALYKNIAKCLMVNCWYKSEHESEGMWGLYSRGGIAIRTSVGALKSALADDQEGRVIHVGAIKYIDFTNESLKPSDCVSEDGHLIGMLKRVAYAHENEVRMFITRDRVRGSLELQEPAPTTVRVSVTKLLEGVVISPFAGETIQRSVRAVCRWGGIDEHIVAKSSLLDNCEYLLDAYK
ncbi:DUF2971 domain-containing protein [Ralstonia nicotianae]